MRYGVFADVHSNLEALAAALDLFRSEKIGHYLCMGDLVGYGPDPNECVSLVRKLPDLHIVAGNHDRAACGLKDTTWFNEFARKAIVWTRKTLTPDNLMYLSELPRVARLQDMMLVHGSPRDPLGEYLLTREQYADNYESLTAALTFIGHSHVPFVFGREADYTFRDPSPVPLPAKEKFIVNAGSVGQPRDADARAACGIYDSSARTFSLYRLDYDYAATQDKMYRARLPVFLIERLGHGK